MSYGKIFRKSDRTLNFGWHFCRTSLINSKVYNLYLLIWGFVAFFAQHGNELSVNVITVNAHENKK